MKKACPYCGRVHSSNYDCDRGVKVHYHRAESENGRYTRKWKNKSREIKDKSWFFCAYCLFKGYITFRNLETHHIIKIRDRPDLLLEDDNLVCLCADCHDRAEIGEISNAVLKKLVKLRNSYEDDVPPPPLLCWHPGGEGKTSTTEPHE